ncbi:MetQ/NlpA family ABC transporter substrate-binding protein [Xylocopilactobacillus apicola]|uniref:Lipoprotein n=1 Tax=Xylocopilactobacillus apicola TaxID=2932184 RepID=A0AAU9D4X4_9LACO|nr:MetQ/NlpA family ABC transporter substrate-binding protein [Xylocopilactobacillus apicola]BDR58543.1 lipoprotein [Xylocopilactobacillus apicola]BDR58565.1 lipoprotein [Xylocopilactobacillus apicola]
MKKYQKLLLLVLTFCAALFLVSCGSSKKSESSSEGTKTVKVGIIGSDERVWDAIKPELKKKGIEVKLVQFTTYDQPNQALVSGDIDLNSYQHIFYLNNWNKAHHADLVPIGNTIIAPLAVYSKKIKSIDNLKSGDTISIPNDATNQARALQLLESAKVITLKSGVEIPTPNDVVKNPKKVKITPLDASQTARSLDDVTVAIINNGVALDAKLNPHTAIYTEKITKKSKPWINVLVAQKKDKNNKTYQEVVKAYQTEKVAQKLKEVYQGSSVPAWNYKF